MFVLFIIIESKMLWHTTDVYPYDNNINFPLTSL